MTKNQAKNLVKVKESAIMRAVLQLAGYHPKVAKAWRQNSGAMQIEGRFVQFASEPGLPDICGFMKSGRALYLEVKARNGQLTYWQRRFMEDAVRAGCVAGVVRSVDEALAILEAA